MLDTILARELAAFQRDLDYRKEEGAKGAAKLSKLLPKIRAVGLPPPNFAGLLMRDMTAKKEVTHGSPGACAWATWHGSDVSSIFSVRVGERIRLEVPDLEIHRIVTEKQLLAAAKEFAARKRPRR